MPVHEQQAELANDNTKMGLLGKAAGDIREQPERWNQALNGGAGGFEANPNYADNPTALGDVTARSEN